uniref:PlsC domain-containing protein n=1 Tax=Mesocestoides corti TaxID=53468 RepID=A0A5K3EZB1_MESCO
MTPEGTLNEPSSPVPPPVYPVSKRQRILCIASFLFLVATGYFGSVFMMAPFLPLAFLAPSYFLFFMDCGVHLWSMLAEVLINGVLRIRVRVFGDKFADASTDAATDNTSSSSSSIALLNHRTRLDWLFVFCFGRYARHLKIVLKQELAGLPGVGWAMQLDSFIFLRRKIAVDQARIDQALEYLLSLEGRAHVLIFPEGTNLEPSTIEKSDRYAEKMGLPKHRYTLHPRITGFEHFVRAMGKDLAYVYDITVAYPYTLTESELKMATGDCPQEVHYHVRQWAVSELPPISDEKPTNPGTPAISALGRWLQQRWTEKEELLRNYYALPPEERRFPGPEIDREGAVIGGSVDAGWSLQAYVVFAYWILFLYFSIAIIYHSWLIRLYVLAVNVFFVYQGYKTGLGEWVAESAGILMQGSSEPQVNGTPKKDE